MRDTNPLLMRICKFYTMSIEDYQKTPFFPNTPWLNYEFTGAFEYEFKEE
ncbi:MAG: hypothetical protein J5798_06265 [Spirochaetaceae bacterium]|nr:hypothetical protein [Spirochaetaceae bacterium]